MKTNDAKKTKEFVEAIKLWILSFEIILSLFAPFVFIRDIRGTLFAGTRVDSRSRRG
jgi:hypothetical protein